MNSGPGIAVGPSASELAESQAMAVELLDSIAGMIFAVLDTSIAPAPESLMLAAARVFESLSSRVLPAPGNEDGILVCLTELSSQTMALVSGVSEIGRSLPVHVQERLHGAAVRSILLLAAPSAGFLQGTDVAQDENRIAALGQIVGPLCARLVEAQQMAETSAGALDAGVLRQVGQCGSLLSVVVRSVRNASSDVKVRVWESVHAGMEPAIALVGALLSGPSPGGAAAARSASCSLLGLVHCSVDALRRQMGIERISQTVKYVLDLFESFLAADRDGPAAGRRTLLVRKLMTLLCLVVSEPTKAFQALLPDILSLSVDQIVPLALSTSQAAPAGAAGGGGAAESTAEHLVDPSMAEQVLRIFQESLTQHTAYFVSTQRTDDGISRDVASPQAAGHLAAILALCLRIVSLPTAPPRLVRAAVECLADSQRRHHVFDLQVLRESVLVHSDGMGGGTGLSTAMVVEALLHTLTEDNHAICREDISTLIYQIAASDGSGFFAQILPQCLMGGGGIWEGAAQGLTDDQRTNLHASFAGAGMDTPSFMAGLTHFIADTRYHLSVNQACTTSLAIS